MTPRQSLYNTTRKKLTRLPNLPTISTGNRTRKEVEVLKVLGDDSVCFEPIQFVVSEQDSVFPGYLCALVPSM